MVLKDAVIEFVAGYFSTCKRSEKTKAAYKIDLAQLENHIGTAEQLEAIKAERLEAWASEMRSRGYSSTSIRRKFATSRIFFGYWVRKGMLDRSPLWKIRLDLGRERLLPRNLAASDAKRLMEEVWRRVEPLTSTAVVPNDQRFLRLRDLAAIEILFATGIRVGELVTLRLRDWRDDDGSFLVYGKGSRERLALLPDDRSLKAVKMYLLHRTAMNLGHDGLILNASGGTISTQGVARILAQAADGAKVSTRVTPHMIRHTVATMLLRYGADIRVVQEILGHASISTTQRYTHVSKEHMLATLRARHPNHHLGISTHGVSEASSSVGP
jgi:site-specific recombinase XerD